MDDYLYHFGVKGMKWGVRNKKASVTKRRGAKKKKAANKKSIKQRAKERIAKVDKQKVKQIAKSTAIIAGKVAVTAALGYAGSMAVSELHTMWQTNHPVKWNDDVKRKAFDPDYHWDSNTGNWTNAGTSWYKKKKV